MVAKIQGEPIDIVLKQVYMHTTDHDDKIDMLYKEITINRWGQIT